MNKLAILTLGVLINVVAFADTVDKEPPKLSAQEAARELANPNTVLASLTLKTQYRTYDGDLPGAGDQEGFTLLFQPSFPLPLDSGAKIFFRPAFPLVTEQHYFDPSSSDFKSKTGFGDISFDLSYGRTLKNGLIYSTGIFASMPTASSDKLGTDKWTLGPELFLGHLSKTFIGGALASHQWDVGGSGDQDISVTTFQVFGVLLPGKGWNVGTVPIISYDWENEDWSVPLNVTGGRTLILSGRPWRFGLELNYYVERPEEFGAKWMLGFNITPVVKNTAANWFRRK